METGHRNQVYRAPWNAMALLWQRGRKVGEGGFCHRLLLFNFCRQFAKMATSTLQHLL